MSELIKCPDCGCEISVSSNSTFIECPICKKRVDVGAALSKKAMEKKGLISVIKYEGPNDVFIWKHPIEDFNTGSQLIVHESQEAIFFKDGKALDLFGPGRYTLETQNIPLLKELYKIPTGKETIFHTEIYYINLVTQMGIKWGTDSKVRMFDPISGLHLELGASGEFNLRVENSRKLLVKLVGTANGLNQSEILGNDFSTKTMNSKFKALVINKVKTFLAKTIRENDINILEVDEYLEDLSIIIKEKINLALADYGLIMPEFYITTIVTPDDDPNFIRLKQQYAERYLRVQQERILKAEAEAKQERKIVEAQTGAQEQLIAAQAEAQAYKMKAEAEAAEMRMKGYTYQQETQRRVAEAAASNTGGGSASTVGAVNSMVGVGVGVGVMSEVVNQVKGAMSNTASQGIEAGKEVVSNVNNDEWECPNCHVKLTTPFCPNCGTPKQQIEKNNDSWDCSCGNKGITTLFCPLCGKKKGE